MAIESSPACVSWLTISANPAKLRRQMIQSFRANCTPEELARELEPSTHAIRKWIAQTERNEGRRAYGLTSGGREELRRLKTKSRRLREEREILA